MTSNITPLFLPLFLSHKQGQLPPRLFTVGRLDVATSGLVFVTNDGEKERQQGQTQQQSCSSKQSSHLVAAGGSKSQ